MSEPIRFFYRGQVHSVDRAAPTQTVLQYLRDERRHTGTKEGCAEGDCGACTVVVGELAHGALRTKAVNACIQFLPALDGKALFTVEDLEQADGALHPVQQAMVECHGSQCGFCTPGFVMSLWALYLAQQNRADGSQGGPSRRAVDDALAGNLCRCTGYRPIIDAAQRMVELPPVPFNAAAVASALQGIARSEPLHYTAAGRHFYAPRTLAELVARRVASPEACLVAGATDVGLWVTKQLRDLGDIVYLGQVAELKRIASADGFLEIGAGVSLEDAYGAICARYPAELTEMRQRFASLLIRNAGTLGGNVANGSPIGDSMPWLIALGARVVLHGAAGARILPLEDFYLGYQRKDLRPDECVAAVRIPDRPANQVFRTYKVAKRFDQDISAVCGAFALRLDGAVITQARVAFGGMAATPRRAAHTEAALVGRNWDAQTLQQARHAMAQDYQPLSDLRAGAGYRSAVAQNLLRRFWLETRPEAPLAAEEVNVFAQGLA